MSFKEFFITALTSGAVGSVGTILVQKFWTSKIKPWLLAEEQSIGKAILKKLGLST